MNKDYVPLARKYAIAYLNAFGNTLNEKAVNEIGLIGDFFEHNRSVLFFLKLPAKFNRVKVHIIKRLREQLPMSEQLTKLIDLLLSQQRLFMLPTVCASIKEVFDERNQIINARLESSHPLDEKQIIILKNYFEQLTGTKIETQPVVKPSLIAGVRLQADTVLWEYSVAKQLRNAERLLSNGD
ncbi:MAG TPA: ATP synthase F1 subunit delta [Candidatus Babeliales bacterium]|nr:ATP synthase F1 subunit delta [Candidatus Babeliales bacterium]